MSSDPYALDPSKCQGAVSFNVAPWITIQCHRTPRHAGEHEASVIAPVQTGKREPFGISRPAGSAPSTARVWMSWAQDVTTEESA